MKKLLTMLLAIMLLTACASCALAEDDRVLKVTGSATVTLAPDTVTIRLGVNTKDQNVQTAQQQNAQIMETVKRAIFALGVEEKDVITDYFNVYNTTDYGTDGQPKKEYFVIEHMLRVTVRDLNQVGAVLDAAVNAGANQSSGIEFSSSKANEAYQKALARAVEDAAMKAQIMAAAAGKQLGDLLEMQAQDTTYYSMRDYGVSNTYPLAASVKADTVISGGDIAVSATVNLEYAFR